MIIPTVVNKKQGTQYLHDIFSMLLEKGIIFLSGQIDDEMANVIVAQLLYLENKAPGKPIQMYIQSPGGSVTAGMGIIDTMDHVKQVSPIQTVCVGVAASMASVILSNGTKGYRYILPNAEVMIHQPLGGAQGQADDIEIAANRILRIRQSLYEILSKNTGVPVEQIKKDASRDNWLTAEDAVKYGIVDSILKTNESLHRIEAQNKHKKALVS